MWSGRFLLWHFRFCWKIPISHKDPTLFVNDWLCWRQCESGGISAVKSSDGRHTIVLPPHKVRSAKTKFTMWHKILHFFSNNTPHVFIPFWGKDRLNLPSALKPVWSKRLVEIFEPVFDPKPISLKKKTFTFPQAFVSVQKFTKAHSHRAQTSRKKHPSQIDHWQFTKLEEMGPRFTYVLVLSSPELVEENLWMVWKASQLVQVFLGKSRGSLKCQQSQSITTEDDFRSTCVFIRLFLRSHFLPMLL